MVQLACVHSVPDEVKDGGPSSGTYTAATYQGAYPKHEVAKRQTMSLRAAVKACDPDAVRRALEKLEGNAEAALDATDGMGRTLLHVSATRLGSADVTDMLLAHKARPDVRDANDQTPLALILAAVADDASDVASAASVVSSLLCARAMCLLAWLPGASGLNVGRLCFTKTRTSVRASRSSLQSILLVNPNNSIKNQLFFMPFQSSNELRWPLQRFGFAEGFYIWFACSPLVASFGELAAQISWPRPGAAARWPGRAGPYAGPGRSTIPNVLAQL